MKAFGRLCVAGALTFCVAAQTVDREANWREDLKFFASELAKRQKDFGKLYPASRFNEEVDSMAADIPKASDEELTLRLVRLMASANVAHNGARPKDWSFWRALPVRFEWFPEGLFVTQATRLHSGLIGERVVSIASLTPEQLFEKVTPFVAHENEGWLRLQSTDRMVSVTLLEYLGIVQKGQSVRLTLAGRDGKPHELELREANPTAEWVGFHEGLGVARPLFFTRPDQKYWFQFLADTGTEFIQYNQCENDPAQPFSEFTKAVMADLAVHSVNRVVIDLRLNEGGNSEIIRPLISGLKAWNSGRKAIYVLTGPETFSSGVDDTVYLRAMLGAKVVGESPGEPLNSYGEVRDFKLPHSGISIRYTLSYEPLALMPRSSIGYAWSAVRYVTHSYGGGQLKPDIEVHRTFADALAGRDPVVERAIAGK